MPGESVDFDRAERVVNKFIVRKVCIRRCIVAQREKEGGSGGGGERAMDLFAHSFV